MRDTKGVAMTVLQRIEAMKEKYDGTVKRVDEIEAFLSLYYLAHILADALSAARAELRRAGRSVSKVDDILARSEHER